MTPTDKAQWIAREDWPMPLHPVLGPFKTDGRVYLEMAGGDVKLCSACQAAWNDKNVVAARTIYGSTAEWADKATKPGSDEAQAERDKRYYEIVADKINLRGQLDEARGIVARLLTQATNLKDREAATSFLNRTAKGASK